MILSFIKIRFALGFQHFPRDFANVNEWKIMFDPSIGMLLFFHEEPLSLLSRVMSLEKTCHRDFRPVPTQTGLYNYRRMMARVWNSGFRR